MLVLIFPTVAFAYIDPGTGAYVVQSVIAVCSAVVFYVSHPIRLIERAWARFVKGSSASHSE